MTESGMNSAVKLLFQRCGSHKEAASLLGYSDRQYRNIRRKIERGEKVSVHVFKAFSGLLKANADGVNYGRQ